MRSFPKVVIVEMASQAVGAATVYESMQGWHCLGMIIKTVH